MRLEPTIDGTWLCSGEYLGRRYVCEGDTRTEARHAALQLMAGIEADERGFRVINGGRA